MKRDEMRTNRHIRRSVTASKMGCLGEEKRRQD